MVPGNHGDMSENNSTPDSTPTPDRTADDQPTEVFAPAQPTGPATPTAAAGDAPRTDAAPTGADGRPAKRRGRTALLAGAGVLGAALLIGGGVAIGAAIDDDDDDRIGGLVADQRGDAGSDSGDRAGAADNDGTPDRGRGDAGTDSDDDRRADSDDDRASDEADDDSSSNLPATAGAASGAELDEIARAAASVAEGEPVSIEANRGGSWDVKLRGADGSEAEVLVAADGSATVHETEAADGDDRAATNVLDAKTLDTMVAAALAETDGRVIEIDADDDSRSPFDVSVLTGDGRIVEITLDVSGAVLATELDD